MAREPYANELRRKREEASRELADMRGEPDADITPLGRARTAKSRGDRLFEISLPVSSITGSAFLGGTESRTNEAERDPDHLGAIEELGWRLEHTGYVFVQTESESSNRFFLTGTRVAVSGVVIGTYVFRNTDLDQPSI